MHLPILLALFVAPADAPVPVKDAAARMTVPPGFKVTLFAGEPDLVQPIAFSFDDRGRLWVVENHSYPDWKAKPEDRVLIFEDKDGDGTFDVKTVFWDKGQNLSGINLGYGGVWLCSTPNLIFIPDKDGDDKPDGPPQVILDGWDLKAKHNVFNSLTWGPDGWLYGCNGIMSNSRVGRPGTPDELRTPINCGVWRYHPTYKKFEAVAHGTTNPWGLDFDEHGQMFITNCVIEHAWHVVPGGNYKRMYGQPFNPNIYELMESPVDHVHWNRAEAWSDIRSLGVTTTTDLAGGGHAHSGAMIYLGDNWPAEYRNNLFTCNIHGNRINRDILEPKGSSYVIKHAPDILNAHDPWFRGLALQYGPDGGVYVADWSDTGECHDYEDIHRENGRIYKVTYGTPKTKPVDLTKLSDKELVELHTSTNQWQVRHARRIVSERAATNALDPVAVKALTEDIFLPDSTIRRLDALWTTYACGLARREHLLALLSDKDPWLRSWAIRLLFDVRPGAREKTKPDDQEIYLELSERAIKESSLSVLLSLASVLPQIPLPNRWIILRSLSKRADIASDRNLSLMIWYAIEGSAGPVLALAESSQIPLLSRLIIRRYTSTDLTELDPVVKTIVDSRAPTRHVLLEGMLEGLGSRQRVHMPGNWPEVSKVLLADTDPGVRILTLKVGLFFGDQDASATLRKMAADVASAPSARIDAIASLIQGKDLELAPRLHKLLADPAVRAAAVRGLAAVGTAETPALILKVYPSLNDTEKADAIATLASRPTYAVALLEAVASGKVPRADVNRASLYALAGHENPRVKTMLSDTFGLVRPSSQEKKAAIARFKEELTPEQLARADLTHGRALFAKTCTSCHILFDAGNKVGPELTGSQRTNLDYVLTNVIDPSALVGGDYRVNVFSTFDGRVVSGIIQREDERSIAVRTANDIVILPKDEIEARRATNDSLMPEGLLNGLSKEDVRDLVGYLASPTQVPLSVAPK
jgi:putative membrane-bound dehydrogenase-like protein